MSCAPPVRTIRSRRCKPMFASFCLPNTLRRHLRFFLITVCCFSSSLTLWGLQIGAAAEPINFDRDIRPILSEHCYTCHGPDAGKLKAGLRLDRKESTFGPLESGATAVVPGKPSESELVRRIHAKDADEVMPPAEGGKPLTNEQILALEQWIASGAGWSNHWAFERIESPPVPKLDLNGRANNPIDHFVLAKLVANKLKQSPQESKERLIRRVTLDLTGLPPTIKEVDDFLADESPLAFERVVDRLLGSQHFGERLALPWLDLARYGDTSGYHNDSLRDMWLWREWVIGAFNKNLPFDQFTIEQLAGDLLPSATIDQQVASGFHRNVMTSDEGGLIDAEYRNLYVVDRIATTGVTWLGMTIACAQCHDHKYDPMTQRDYYAFYAFFNNVPENGKDGVRDRNPKPFLSVPSEAQQMQLAQHAEQLAAAETQLSELTKTLPERQTAWEQTLVSTGSSGSQAALPIADVYFPLDENGNGQQADASELTAKPDGNVQFDEGMVGKSFKPAKTSWFEYGETFNFEKDQAFSVAAYLMVTPEGGSPFGKMNDGDGARGWDVEFHGLRPSVHLIHRFPKNAIHIQADEDLPANVFTHLAFTYDGSGKASGLKLYVNGVLAKTSVKTDNLKGSILSGTPFSIGRRGGSSTPFAGRIDDLRVYKRELNANDVAAMNAAETHKIVSTPVEKRTAKQKEQLEKFFRQTQVPEFAAMQKTVADVRKTKDAFAATIPNTMVMSEMEKPRETFIKVRGNYDQDGEKVTAAVPSFLPQVPALSDGRQLNRLHLAEWLVSRDHPLTARVTMNRWWAMLFGTGIVKTLNDFGSQGERPSHPELLDWLSADLMRDWDTKRVIKQIVMSATYQQSSQVTRELLTVDQENRLLARGPRQRLDAEAIRDNSLSIAGILNPAIGGKSIKPAQPAGTWEINEMGGYPYDKSTGNDLYRRGLYVYWRRSTVYPSFVTLDAPTREFCVAQRAKTSTPLQSLVLMNDPVFVEAARAFAQRLLAEPNLDSSARTRMAWRLALARNPSEAEHAILNRTLEQQLVTYRKDKEAAKKLISIGDLPKPSSYDDSELAAWTALSNVILNLNETISN